MKLSTLAGLIALAVAALVSGAWMVHIGPDDTTIGQAQLQDALQHEKAQRKQDRVEAIIRRHRQQLGDL